MSELLEAALEYARKGWPVFPARLANGAKIPWLDHRAEDCPNGVGGCGYKHATCSEQQIRKWWTEKPDAWVAVSCEGAGWAVVDVDPRNGGVRPANCVPTLLQQTMSGGEHLIYLSPPGGPGTGSLGPGVDVKYRGYVIVAPSPGYTWSHEVDPVPWPFGVQRGNGKATGGLSREKVTQGIPYGEHDTQLFKYAAELRGRGTVSLEEARDLLRTAALRCLPPTNGAPWTGYDPEEAAKKADWAWAKYEGTTAEERAAAFMMGKQDAEPEPEPEVEEEPEPNWDADWPTMEDAAYAGLTGEVVDTLAPATEADRVAILVEFLVAFGNLVGPYPHLWLSGKHHAKLFACLVGNTATARKSGGWGVVRELLRLVDPEWILRAEAGDGLSSGEGLIFEVRDARVLRNGRTPVTDEGVTDKRLLVHDAEFSGRTLTAVRRDNNTLSAILRDAWDKEQLRTRTINPVTATGAHISVVGHTTFKELAIKMSDVDIANGLANRFIYFPVRNAQELPFGGTLDYAALERLAGKVRQRVEAAALRGKMEYGMSGRAVWPAHYSRMRSAAPDGPLGEITARSTTQVQRLSLIYALLDGADTIEADHIESAMAVVRYAWFGARMLLGAAVESFGSRDADAMYKMLVKSAKVWSLTELRKELKMNGERAGRALTTLKQKQAVVVAFETRPGGGRPKTLVRAH